MAKRQRTSKTQSKSAISPVMIIGIVAAAVLLVGGLILLGTQGSGGGNVSVDMSQFPTFGSPDAPITMVEYSDYG